MNDKLSRQNRVLYACGIIPVVWLALLAAPLLEGGLGTLLEGFGTALENPFHIIWCDKSLKTLLIFLMLYCRALLCNSTAESWQAIPSTGQSVRSD